MRTNSRLVFLGAVLLVTSSWAQGGPPATRASVSLPSVVDLVDSVKNSIVNVDVLLSGGRGEEEKRGSGSGFIIDGKGLILTNNHVVEKAQSIRVRLDDGRLWAAEVLGRDPLTDVALLQLNGKVSNLPVTILGDSDNLRPGDWVVAIGNPFGLASSVSMGIVSARARDMGIGPYDEFIQTDAAINPGNSGGPLFNMRGQVVGMNTAIINGGGGGLGFAVPINVAKALVPMLEKDGVVTRGWLGVHTQDFTPELGKAMQVPVSEGAMVTVLPEGSPAQKSGLKEDDILVEWDGRKVRSRMALMKMVALKLPGSKASMTVYRGSKRLELTVTMGTRPDLEGVAVVKREAKKEAPATPKLGLVVEENSDKAVGGVKVTSVAVGSPAERAGLWNGAVITEIDRRRITSANEFINYVKGASSGSALLLRLKNSQSDEKRVWAALVIP